MLKSGLYCIVATWTLLFCTCTALPDIHKQMSAAQLQSVFHIDHPDDVPPYEMVTLVHHGSSHHHTVKRSVATAAASINNAANTLPATDKASEHHVKKDLSKSAYYSELKMIANHATNISSSSSNSSNSNVSIGGASNATTSDGNVSNSSIAVAALPQLSVSEMIDRGVDLSKLSEHNVSISAFGETYNLTLRPTQGLFKNGPQSLKMWMVHSDANATQGLQYDEVMDDSTEHVGEVFQDQYNMAAILMRRQLEHGDLLMEGSIGHELVIRPVPVELTGAAGTHHIAYKRKASQMDQNSDFAYMEPDHLSKRYRRKRSTEDSSSSGSRSKRQVPHIIYPEILVIVDYDGYRLHGGNNADVKKYFVSFWNGVDLRYRLLKGPRIRISIAGIIISRGRDATPYLERNRVGRDAIDSAAALTDMGKYLFRERRLPVYDIAVAITKLDMCRRNFPTDICNRGTAGFAYVGGACVVNKRLEKVNSVAIIEDTGGFSGIIVAAHEVGHLLGAVHDGSPPPSYLGGPGAEKCRWEDGFIMSDLRHTERGFRWSPCTIQSFHHFLNGDTASCLHNAPHEDEALGRTLPGKLLTLDAQCRRDRGTTACFKDERVCAQLFCFDAASGYCVAYRPAAEGSPCGNGVLCSDGRCVTAPLDDRDNENQIPDYSQHTPSYASPNAYNPQINTESYSYNEEPEAVSSTARPPTKVTTRRTTTTTTTTPAPTTAPDYSAYCATVTDTKDIYYKYYCEPLLSSTTYDYNAFFDFSTKSTTSPTTTISKTTTKKPTRTISPFYYGLNYQKDKTSTTTTTTTTKYPSFFRSSSTTTTKSPFVFINRFTTSSSAAATTTTTIAPPSTASAISKSSSALTVTRNPVFDVYLKRLASTTKSPYNFENFAQYFKTSTTNPKYAYNLFGANSNMNATMVAAASSPSAVALSPSAAATTGRK